MKSLWLIQTQQVGQEQEQDQLRNLGNNLNGRDMAPASVSLEDLCFSQGGCFTVPQTQGEFFNCIFSITVSLQCK